MSKTVDTNLRIRAQNLASKTLDEIAADIDRLTKAQQDQTKASALAARSTKELAAEQAELSAISKELERRSKLANTYVEQTKQIREMARQLQELTAVSQQAKLGLAFGTPKQFAATDREIAKLSEDMQKLVDRNRSTGASLQALGVDTTQLATGTGTLSTLVERAATAYAGATSDIKRYGAAAKEAADIQAEAQRRLLASPRAPAGIASLAPNATQSANRAAELAALRADIELRSEQARIAGVQAEAARRLAEEQAKQAAIQEVNNRLSKEAYAAADRKAELAALRADIELRSAQARSMEIAAEAARRLAAEQAKEASQQPVITAGVRDYISVTNARILRQNALNDVFGRQLAEQERLKKVEQETIDRSQRIAALLGSERGQRMLAAEAARQQATAVDKSAAATRKAEKAQGLFSDTGRKSLSVYQRMRGQILGLASAYLGIYQSITVVTDAIAAVNRNNTLQIGLQAANNNNIAAAANDYKYLREEAQRLGLVFDELAPKFANIKIGASVAGFTTTQTRKVFTDIQTIVAGLNLTADQADRVNYAVTQIFSKGRVYSEELNGQLGDVLPGAFATFAASIGKSGEELTKMLKDGKVGLDDFAKFLETYSARYTGNLAQITDRLQGSINRARNAYNDWLRDLLNGQNQEALKGAFKTIEEFFAGQQGKEFAKALGDAFKFAVDVFILFAKNVDIAMAGLKAFIAVQVIKFGVDTYSTVVKAAGGMLTFARDVKVATTATEVLTGRLRLLQLAFGPLGIALVAAGAAFTAFYTGAKNAEEEASKFIDTLHRVNQAKGTAQITDGIKELQSGLKDTNAELDKLYEIRKNWNSLDPSKGITAVAKAATRNLLTQTDLEGKIAELRNRQSTQMQLLEVASKRLTKAKGEEAKAEEDAAKAAAARGKPEVDGDAAKRAKDAEKAENAAEAAARRRANVQRAFEKESLDIGKEILQLQTDTGLLTQEQINANYRAQVKVGGLIDNQIAERRLALEKLQQDAAAAGVDASGGATTIDGQLQLLDAQLRARAEQSKKAAEIEMREKSVNDLIEARNSKIQLINALQENGSISPLEAWRQTNDAQDQYNAKIREQISLFQMYLATIDPESDLGKRLGVEKLIQDMELASARARKLSNMELFSQKYGQQIADGLGGAMGALATGLAGAIQQTNSWSDAFKNAADAFRSFAADFLVQIGEMIVQAVLLQAIQNAFGGGSGGGYWAAVTKVFTGHTGGVVGGSGRIANNRSMAVNPAVFAGAQRFHGGGFPGLAQNEVPAILKKREEVLTETDPRNALNGGLDPAGKAVFSPTIVNTIDSAEVVRQGMTDRNGQLFINDVLGKNKNQVKRILGIA